MNVPKNSLNIAINRLQQDDIRLALFDDHHAPALTEKARDPRIWQHHHVDFDNPSVFQSIYITKAKNSIANKKRYMFVIYFQNEIIGSTSYYDVELAHLKLKIGYSWLHPDYWGKGINTVVKKLMLAYAFEQLKFKRVAFCIDAENLQSRKAIEKLGIPFEGILYNHQIRPDGSSRNSAIYAITDEEWHLREKK